MRSRLLLPALATALLAAPAAAEDILQLADGRFVEGVPMRVEGDAVVLRYQACEVRVPLSMVEDYVIEGVESAAAETEEEQAKRAEGLVRFRGRWMRPEARDRLVKQEIERRKAEIEEMRAHQEWRNRWQFSTKNFNFESTLLPRINEEYSALLETYFNLFRKEWGVKVPKDWGKLKVCFYHDRKTFNRVSGGRGGILAYYRFVEPRELDFFHDRAVPANTVSAMFHEANHYLTDLVDERFQYPHWINEGMAEYYGASRWDPETGTMTVGHIQDGRLVELKTELEAGTRKRLVDLVGSEARDYDHYYWGWSFVHFLMESPKYQKRFKQFFLDLARAKDVERRRAAWDFLEVSGPECLRAFRKRLGVTKDEDLDALEREWWAYVEALEPDGVRGFEEAGAAAFRQGRWKFRAPRLLKAAIDAGSTDVQTFVQYSRCLLVREESRADAIEYARRACELDPVDADAWANLGYCFHALDRKEEAARYVGLAREMNPAEAYLETDVEDALREALEGSE